MKLIWTATVCVAMLLGASAVAFTQDVPKAPAAAQPAPPALPALFPAEAKFAFLDFQRVASDSVSGKLATRILQELRTKKVTEIDAQSKQLQALASKRDAGVLNGAALAQLVKDMDKLQREIQFSEQNAQAEIQQLQSELETDFGHRVTPVVSEIAREKGLHAVFSTDSGVFYVHPGLDISPEVIKRLDAQPKK
jgi:outer membrane protein